MNNGIINYTTVGELIEELKKFNVDAPVCINGCAEVYTDARPWYYDGGYIARDAKNPNNFLRSKDYSKGNASLGEGFYICCVDLVPQNPEDGHSIEGRSVREIDPDSWAFLEKIEMEERNIFANQTVKYEGTGSYSEEFKCYPVKAYLDSGEFAIAECMRDAKDQLIKIWKDKHEHSKNK